MWSASLSIAKQTGNWRDLREITRGFEPRKGECDCNEGSLALFNMKRIICELSEFAAVLQEDSMFSNVVCCEILI